MPCRHPDIRKFDGIRCCLACGETVFDEPAKRLPTPSIRPDSADAELPYQYVPLNLELGQEIRLIDVLPGHCTEPLVCDIVHANLEDGPGYEAVSYTWATEDGDAKKSCAVFCVRGGTVKITINCEAALRQLRRPGFKRRLWIDSICIDQANVKERNHQVGLMNAIFSNADRVTVCINRSSGSCSSLFEWLRKGYIPSDEVTLPTLSDLEDLFRARYFGRVWIIQEIVLAKMVLLLVNGESLLLSDEVLGCLREFCTSKTIRVPYVLSVVSRRQWPDILTWLSATVQCHATDPRDKVYAILSLLDPATRSIIPVDYSLSIASVYTNVLIAIILNHGDLRILSFITPSKASIWSTPPTLAAEFVDQYIRQTRVTENILETYNYSSTLTLMQFKSNNKGPWRSRTTVSVTTRLDRNYGVIGESTTSSVVIELPSGSSEIPLSGLLPRMRLRAHFIDKICHRRDHVPYTAQAVGDLIHDSANWLNAHNYSWILPFFRHLDRKHHIHPSLLTSFPSICLKEVTEEHMEGYALSDLVQFIRDASDWGEELVLDKYRIVDKLPKRMFQSYHSVGFACSGFDEDDEIFAIDGARTPFILRRTGEQQYRIVASCYLWAALELDYWNPGSKKGLWGAERHEHHREQTQIIEIH